MLVTNFTDGQTDRALFISLLADISKLPINII